MNTDTTFSSGIYQHYKGAYYLALFLVEHHDTRATLVVYFSLEKKTLNVRPLCGAPDDADAWNDDVDPDTGRMFDRENASIAIPVRRFKRTHIDTALLERAYTDAFQTLKDRSYSPNLINLTSLPPPAFVDVITSRILGYVGHVIRASGGR